MQENMKEYFSEKEARKSLGVRPHEVPISMHLS